jgi:hypothetical protein
MRGRVLEASDLVVLRHQIEDRVEHQVHQRELSVDPRPGEVADRHVDALASGFRPQPGDHGVRVVNAADSHASLGER